MMKEFWARLMRFRVLRSLVHHSLVLLGAAGMTFAFFMVLPLLQAIGKQKEDRYAVREVEAFEEEAPEDIVEEEPEEEEPEEEPPELEQEAQPLDLAQLDLMLEGGFGGGWGSTGFEFKLGAVGPVAKGQSVFSSAELDQPPRAINRVAPRMDSKMRRKAPGKVVLIFEVDERGRVSDPRVYDRTDEGFVNAAIEAVKKWKYEPGKRKGEPVRFRMRQSIVFPKG